MLHVGVCCNVEAVLCSLVVICLESADLLADVCVVFCHFPKCVLVHIRIKGEVWRRKKALKKNILLTVPRRSFFCGSFMLLFCLVCAMSLCTSVYMCFVVTYWERADRLALVCGVYCEFVTFPLVSLVRFGT